MILETATAQDWPASSEADLCLTWKASALKPEVVGAERDDLIAPRPAPCLILTTARPAPPCVPRKQASGCRPMVSISLEETQAHATATRMRLGWLDEQTSDDQPGAGKRQLIDKEIANVYTFCVHIWS